MGAEDRHTVPVGDEAADADEYTFRYCLMWAGPKPLQAATGSINACSTFRDATTCSAGWANGRAGFSAAAASSFALTDFRGWSMGAPTQFRDLCSGLSEIPFNGHKDVPDFFWTVVGARVGPADEAVDVVELPYDTPTATFISESGNAPLRGVVAGEGSREDHPLVDGLCLLRAPAALGGEAIRSLVGEGDRERTDDGAAAAAVMTILDPRPCETCFRCGDSVEHAKILCGDRDDLGLT